MLWYTIATLLPASVLVLACLWGETFAGLAFLSVTILAYMMDKIARGMTQSDASGHVLSVVLAALHLPLLGLGAWALSAPEHLGHADRILLFHALGLYFGQISNSNAHELIHARSRWLHRLGVFVYITLLHGHHVSAHLRVHHVHAATDADPNSARKGEGFWRYLRRAWVGEFRAGLRAETARRTRLPQKPAVWTHPYMLYLAGTTLVLISAYSVLGAGGMIAYICVALYAQLQLFLSDYVQHYGLRRAKKNGKPAPIGPQHSWNAPYWYSSAMVLNAAQHSDHHQNPARSYTALRTDPKTMPVLPYALPMMSIIALMPTLWRRLMDPRVAEWQKRANSA